MYFALPAFIASDIHTLYILAIHLSYFEFPTSITVLCALLNIHTWVHGECFISLCPTFPFLLISFYQDVE
ncbi:hypothetical protein DFH29DRAFT_929841 [Suillus ampliporus]|nr:hypothetical protein DFH29DRAFT_929841 [Suillus ampliporus]